MMAHERRRHAAEKKKLAAEPQLQLPFTSTGMPELVRVQPSASVPNSLWYCNNFLCSPEERVAIEQAICTKHRRNEWLDLPKRRLLNLGGVPHPDGMIAEELPSWLQVPVLDRLAAIGVFPESVSPNQILLNEYAPGMGIDPHADGPLYVPCVAIVSLCSSALLHFLEPPGSEVRETNSRWDTGTSLATLLLHPGSLVVFEDDAYERLWHGIKDVEEESVDESTANRALAGAQIGDTLQRGRRLSLTIRAVRHVAVEAHEFLQPAQQEEARRRRDWWARAVSEKHRRPSANRQLEAKPDVAVKLLHGGKSCAVSHRLVKAGYEKSSPALLEWPS
eukprot:gnl/TRDRNA2_/TRDRNA2_80643_c0_seq1.p1 gnl/TRDRNA2_/TRDRNA2_80643_c0~~gnl/TRDRNA2_/TRDRNA2_80643_c0_seq1.p1  ORF type:complete len:360 (-),score=50.30 gnl/TRDRNA2_/TRDRNA2_80643_c0_seq1:135-1136(-)